MVEEYPEEETTMGEEILRELECFLGYEMREIAVDYTSYAMWRYSTSPSRRDVEKYEARLIKEHPKLSPSAHESLRERSLEVMGEWSLVK